MLAGCASIGVVPIGTGTSVELQEDETRLWNRAAEEQRRLDRSGVIYDAPQLQAYLNEVARSMTPEEVKRTEFSFKVSIIKNPLLNAFSLPNGAIYIHTGILARIENEAQLATLLGHEMSHVIQRHALENFRNVHNTAAALATFQLAASGAGRFAPVAGLLGSLGAMAAVSGYSQNSEAEADRLGLDIVVRAGYDPHESPKIFEQLQTFERLQKEPRERKRDEPFLFGSDPDLQDRYDNYAEIVTEKYSDTPGYKGVEPYRNKVHQLLLDNASMDIAMGRFSSAQQSLERFLAVEPNHPRAHYLLGELYRQRAERADRDKAESEYRRALEEDPGYPDPYRGLGILYLKSQLPDWARKAFDKYLALSPAAGDREYIFQYLQRIGMLEGAVE